MLTADGHKGEMSVGGPVCVSSTELFELHDRELTFIDKLVPGLMPLQSR